MKDRHELSFSRPPRDTGLMLEGRVARERRRRKRDRQRLLLTISLGVLAVLAVGWFVARTAPRQVEPAVASAGTAVIARSADMPKTDPDPVSEPTPLLAAYRDVALHVPVPAEDLTEAAFHQASYTYAQHLTTQLPTFPTDKAKNKKGTGRAKEGELADEQGWLTGSVLRLWRNRPGKPDTSADVGAPAGTPVVSPVTGSVLAVKAYKLYGKYPDYEVHIRPTAHSDLDAVLIHIDKPCVVRGDEVVGGMTQIGVVRKLSNRMRLQLSDYTPGPGDHTHMQLNRVKPGTIEGVTKP